MKPSAPVPEPLPATPVRPLATDVKDDHRQDDRLDEELDGTFPASDPVPWQHET